LLLFRSSASVCAPASVGTTSSQRIVPISMTSINENKFSLNCCDLIGRGAIFDEIRPPIGAQPNRGHHIHDQRATLIPV
jgi:hypothetical protein